jgi:hypothetical protein
MGTHMTQELEDFKKAVQAYKTKHNVADPELNGAEISKKYGFAKPGIVVMDGPASDQIADLAVNDAKLPKATVNDALAKMVADYPKEAGLAVAKLHKYAENSEGAERYKAAAETIGERLQQANKFEELLKGNQGIDVGGKAPQKPVTVGEFIKGR